MKQRNYTRKLTPEQSRMLGMMAYMSDFFTGNKISKTFDTSSQLINYHKKKFEKEVQNAK